MGKYLRILILIAILIVGIITVRIFYRNPSHIVRNSEVSLKLRYKGLAGAKDFATDENGNIFLAFSNKVQYLDIKGKSYDLLKDEKLSISSIAYGGNMLYLASSNDVFGYSLETKTLKTIMSGLPNFGDYKESKLAFNKDKLYISVGSATNSGVVGSDNQWLSKYPFNHDISPYDILLNGKNFGSDKTGAFTAYGSKNVKGQLVPAHLPGNSCLMEYDITSGKYIIYAWGIRNIEGIDFNSEGSIITSVGGMEPRGLRPVIGDSDYIYEISKGRWYGWPDFSGGDPIISPKFKGDGKGKLEFILEQHPDSMPPAPLYQHMNVSSLKTLAVDKNAVLGKKDSIYFYDSKANNLYELGKNKILAKGIEFQGQCNITSLKFAPEELLMLDSVGGEIYSLTLKSAHIKISNFNNILFYMIGIIIIIIVKILWNNNSR